jgi:DeoR/GlpR family transcriptional regulator of sugar metabolism
MASLAGQRRLQIVELLALNQVVNVSHLSDQFGVSEVSIRRDLDQLERRGLLKRVHGGAVAVPTGRGNDRYAFQPLPVSQTDPMFVAKEQIGCEAAKLIRPGDHLILHSGTTVQQVARHISPELLTSGDLTVITGSLPIVDILGRWKGIHLILLGGVFLPGYEIVVGPQTVEQIRHLHAERVFVGTDGLTFDRGVTTANVLEAEADRATIAASSEIIVVTDSSKIGKSGLVTILSLNRIHELITDAGAPESFVTMVRNLGVQVTLV